MSVTTLSELFLKAASLNKPDCLLYKVGGTYQPVSTAELVDRVRRLAKALAELGLEPGDRVALMSENGPHWPAVDFATLCANGVLVPIYPTLLPDQASYIANDCGAKIVVAETTNHLEGFLSRTAEMPAVQHFVLIKGESSDPRVTTLSALLERGTGADPAHFEEKARSAKPDDLATFVYTSGTTGQPKGVMLTHRNIVSNVVAAMEIAAPCGALHGALLPPPLALVRAHGRLLLLLHGLHHRLCRVGGDGGGEPPGGEAARLRVGAARLREGAVSGAGRTWPRGRRSTEDLPLGGRGGARGARLAPQAAGGRRGPGIKLNLADKLVFGKIRERLGGRFEMALSGGAPLARDVAEFFGAAGSRSTKGMGSPRPRRSSR